MLKNLIQTRLRLYKRLLQREAADLYLLLTLLGFAGSVSLTRLFLSVTNYPQIGSGELHIAHVLWGGLLLYVAALLPLVFANRSVYSASAILAGAGVGLFIDEVGKFITARNDYFFPVSASIIYVLFLLTLVLFLHIRRLARTRARDELMRVFEDIWEAMHHALTARQYRRLRDRLEAAASAAPSPRHANLARALVEFLDEDAEPDDEPAGFTKNPQRPVRRVIGRLVSRQTLRVLLIVGLVGIGLLTLKNPVNVLLAPWLPPAVTDLLTNLRLGRHIDAPATALWPSIRLGLEVVVGVLLLLSAALLGARKNRLGAALAYLGLLLSLTTVDILLFYFEQFSSIITTAIQFLLLVGVLIYRRHKT
jgi:hypothetical protein